MMMSNTSNITTPSSVRSVVRRVMSPSMSPTARSPAGPLTSDASRSLNGSCGGGGTNTTALTVTERMHIQQLRAVRDSINPLAALVARYQLHGIDSVKHSVTKVETFLSGTGDELDFRHFASECYVIAAQLEQQLVTMRQEVSFLTLTGSSVGSSFETSTKTPGGADGEPQQSKLCNNKTNCSNSKVMHIIGERQLSPSTRSGGGGPGSNYLSTVNNSAGGAARGSPPSSGDSPAEMPCILQHPPLEAFKPAVVVPRNEVTRLNNNNTNELLTKSQLDGSDVELLPMVSPHSHIPDGAVSFALPGNRSQHTTSTDSLRILMDAALNGSGAGGSSYMAASTSRGVINRTDPTGNRMGEAARKAESVENVETSRRSSTPLSQSTTPNGRHPGPGLFRVNSFAGSVISPQNKLRGGGVGGSGGGETGPRNNLHSNLLLHDDFTAALKSSSTLIEQAVSQVDQKLGLSKASEAFDVEAAFVAVEQTELVALTKTMLSKCREAASISQNAFAHQQQLLQYQIASRAAFDRRKSSLMFHHPSTAGGPHVVSPSTAASRKMSAGFPLAAGGSPGEGGSSCFARAGDEMNDIIHGLIGPGNNVIMTTGAQRSPSSGVGGNGNKNSHRFSIAASTMSSQQKMMCSVSVEPKQFAAFLVGGGEEALKFNKDARGEKKSTDSGEFTDIGGQEGTLQPSTTGEFNGSTSSDLRLVASIEEKFIPKAITTDRVEEGEDAAGFQTLNFYTILGEAGRGSYGAVMFAQTEAGEDRAIKIIPKNTLKLDYAAALRANRQQTAGDYYDAAAAADDEEANTRGEDNNRKEANRKRTPSGVSAANREIEVMMKIRHPNILPLLEVMDDPEKDLVYLVMPYMERGPLLKVSSVGTCAPLDFDVVKGYTRQLVNAVLYLHERHIIHRDIKPENVLLGNDGRVYLSDFGVSKMFDKGQAHEVEETEGTPSFLAPETYPEFFDMHPASTPATLSISSKAGAVEGKPLDVWALGVTVYLMLFGRLPFEGCNQADLKRHVLEDVLEFPMGGGASSGVDESFFSPHLADISIGSSTSGSPLPQQQLPSLSAGTGGGGGTGGDSSPSLHTATTMMSNGGGTSLSSSPSSFSPRSGVSSEEELLRDLVKQMLVKDPRERASIRECSFHPAICRDKRANLKWTKRKSERKKDVAECSSKRKSSKENS